MVDIFLAKFSNELKNRFSNIPNKTGTVTIKNILRAMSKSEVPWFDRLVPRSDNEIPKINGIVITLKMLITAVKEIDNATSPFAKEVSILEVAPPGAAASIITPMAISGDNGQIETKMIATIGKIINWEKKPIKNSLGLINILVKSFKERPSPKENIINARAIGRTTSVTIFMKINYHLIP